MTITSIEVDKSKRGAEFFGMVDGQIIKVIKETACFFFAEAVNGEEVKISKKTKRACNFYKESSAPTFKF